MYFLTSASAEELLLVLQVNVVMKKVALKAEKSHKITLKPL